MERANYEGQAGRGVQRQEERPEARQGVGLVHSSPWQDASLEAGEGTNRLTNAIALSFVIVVVLICTLCRQSTACSAFVLHKGNECVMAFNENWPGEAQGFVLINQPGRQKRGVTESELWVTKELKPDSAIRWTSKYGSITFNCFGKDLPVFGVNEKGLMVAELAWGQQKPGKLQPGEKPIVWLAWEQYILDQFATVDEALDDIAKSKLGVQVDGHEFFVSDAKGKSGVVMCDVNGNFKVFRGKAMKHPLICNGYPETDPDQLKAYRAFGGKKEMNSFRNFGVSDFGRRYANGIHLLEAYNPEAQCASAYAWMMLEVLNPGDWRFVYDAKAHRAAFCTLRHPKIKWVDFDDIRLGADKPTMILDVQTEPEGDALNRCVPLTSENLLALLKPSYLWGMQGPSPDPAGFSQSGGEAMIQVSHKYGMLTP